MYAWNPLDTESMSAMPIMPMLPANAVRRVRAFFVIRLFSDRWRAVPIDMDLLRRPDALPPVLFFLLIAAGTAAAAAAAALPSGPPAAASAATAEGSNGLLSLMTCPSDSLTILVEYASASSGLCVTMMTSLFSDIFFRMAITWVLVSVSRAPVGSSASMMFGSFMRARAIATRCT